MRAQRSISQGFSSSNFHIIIIVSRLYIYIYIYSNTHVEIASTFTFTNFICNCICFIFPPFCSERWLHDIQPCFFELGFWVAGSLELAGWFGVDCLVPRAVSWCKEVGNLSRVFSTKQSGLRSATTEILISHTLQGSNISHQPGKGKSSTQNCLHRGYVSSQEDIFLRCLGPLAL